ncbi:MAG: hypothetical protein QXQ37_06805 [Nitrososphaerota archaeon]
MMSCPPDKVVFDEQRAEYICTETGEVLEERVPFTDHYYNNMYVTNVPQIERDREKRSKDISIEKLKQEILSHLNEKEKDLFYDILEKVKRVNVEMLIAIYEYIKEKNGEKVAPLRESFGLGSYSIRNKKKVLRQIMRDYDPVLEYINKLPNRDLALKVYETLKRKNIITGLKAKKRLEILKKYLENEELLKGLLEKDKEEISRTILLLSIARRF